MAQKKKKAKKTPDPHKKIKNVEKVINSLISSLVSHLPWTYLDSEEGKAFHRKCVKDYANDIKNLSDLL